MKIVLAAVNAKYIHSNLAVYDLKAYAGKFTREEITLKEYTINQQEDDILRDLFREKPDAVFFSCYIWNISLVRQLACDLAMVLPDALLFAGGPEVSWNSREFLQENPAFQGVLRGEGEASFKELVLRLFRDGLKAELSGIPGLCFRDEADSQMLCDQGVGIPVPLDEIPFVYEKLEDFSNKILYYESSRGCPFNCSYCLSSIDRGLRFRSMDLVKRELAFFLKNNVPQVKFVDRTFNCHHGHAREIWEFLKEHDNGVSNFHFEISADLLTEEETELLCSLRPGLVQLEIGVQSTNLTTIDAIRRKTDLEKLKDRTAKIHSARNIHQHLDLIAGLPYEDFESFRNSFNEVFEMHPEELQLGFLKVLKGSPMEQDAGRYGILYKSTEPYEVLSTRWITYEEILKLKTVESMVEIYYNSSQFRKSLDVLLPCFEDPFTFFLQVGEFYEKKGYTLLSHARIRRYEILLEFAQAFLPDHRIPDLRDALTVDLYLRENLKSRASFMPPDDDRNLKERIRVYRKNHNIPKTAHIEKLYSGRILMFNYEKRDPLTYDASMTDITEEIE